MFLSDLLKGLNVIKIFQTTFGKMAVTSDIQINKIQYDSWKISHGDLFVAIKGKNFDGHKFIQDAINNGSKAIIVEDDNVLPDSYFMHTGVVKIVVPNSRLALAVLSANYWRSPSDKLQLIGVTGTNGKTTVTHILKSIFEEVESNKSNPKKIGLIGTIENKIGDDVIESKLTTPESLDLNELFNKFIESDCSRAVMEVSSHSLHQHRVYGINFNMAVFTNFSQDHLDYHGTMEEYFNSKKILFDNLSENSIAVTNIDDEYGYKIVESTKARIITYGIRSNADLIAENIELGLTHTKFNIVYKNKKFEIESPLIGLFNVYNTIAAAAVVLAYSIEIKIIQSAVGKVKAIRGRFEKISSPKGWIAIVDYAHTPDALEKCLTTIKEIMFKGKSNNGKIITVFGAGGDRDKTKRPMMGKIASELSDIVIITSDNPRTENPYQIMTEIVAGIEKNAGFLQEIDRKRAIEKALQMAESNDVVLIAGKGHEDYQIIGNEKIHFSDREVVEQFINNN